MATNDNSVVVSIVGDAAGIRPAVDLTQSELNSLESTVRQLSANFSKFGTELKQSMDMGARETQQLTTEMRQLHSAIERDEASMRQLGAATRSTAASMGAMGGFVRGAIQGMIAAFTVQAVVGFTNSIADAAERADHMAQQTGMAVAEVQALDVALAGSNLRMEDVAKGLGILATKAEVSGDKTNAAGNALKAMGISAKDGKTNLDRLLGIADQFEKMENGPRKAALAMQLFGKSGRDLIPFLNQGSEAIREQMALAERYGVVNERATERALALDAALDEGKIAWAGLKQTMADAFAPMLTSIVRGFNDMVAAMTKSYQEGGAVKVIFDGIAIAIQACREIINAVGLAFAEIFGNTGDAESWKAGLMEAFQAVATIIKALIVIVVGMADAFKWTFHIIYAAVLNFKANWNENVGQIKLIGQALGMFMQVLGKVIEDALMLRWGAIRSDWNAGMENIRQTVAAKGQEIINEAAKTRAGVQRELDAAANIKNSFGAFFNRMNQPFGMPKDERVKPASGAGALGEVPDFAPTKSGGGSKSNGDSLAEKLEKELEAKKAAWAMEQDAQGQMQRYSLQAEADFWAQALKRADLGAKDKLAIEKKYVAAREALRREEIDKQLDSYRDEIEVAGANSDKKLSILREEQAYVIRMYGAESREARAAADAIVKAEREKQRQIRELQSAINAGVEAKALSEVAEAEATAEFAVEIGRSTKAKLIVQERQFEAQRFQIRRQALMESLRLAQLDPNTSPAKLREIQNQVEDLERQHQAKLTQIDRQAAMQRTQIQRSAINQVGQAFGDHISKMITLQEGWREGLIGIYQSLIQTVASVIQQIIQQWIVAFLTKLILGKQEAASSVASYVGQAGAGGVASMAAAPFPINLTAPAFGASMAAAAAGFGAVAAAEGGDWMVKPGLYELHKDEMVLPAWAATPLRSMISGGAAPGSPLANARGDATRASSKHESNFELHQHLNYQSANLKELLRGSARDMRRWVENQVRNGSLKVPGA
jgi:TP901 family phage tail tape measure protein